MASPEAAASRLFGVVGKNVLVTGGSRGIGYMIAKTFCEHGANVVLTSRDAKACQEAAASLPRCQYVPSNVSSREGCRELAENVSRLFDGRLHVLVNNAGTSWGEPLSRESSPRSNWGWDKVLDLNVKGIFYLSRECLSMLESTATPDDPARIINIGSVTGMVPQEAPTHAYDVSKAAVHQLTKKLSSDFSSKHVTVNAVAPGFVPSRMSQGLATWGADEANIVSRIPLGRMGNTDDMGGACVYLASRAGAWCTGVVLNVDGGTVGSLQIPLSSL